MGLFSSVLHVRDTLPEALISAIDKVLRDAGFLRDEVLPVPAEGPYAIPNHDAWVSDNPCYLISPLYGRWLTVIEAHFAIPDAPHLSEVGHRLSAELSCFTLALVVHDDDLFFYNLDQNGISLDGYNSCPQYFEQVRLTDTQIAEQRHTPMPFQELLPAGRSLEELHALLNRGWWNAYDSNRLDRDGVARSDNDAFVFEGERMTAFGTLLQLHGDNGDYPFTAWGESPAIRWQEFVALRYSKRA